MPRNVAATDARTAPGELMKRCRAPRVTSGASLISSCLNIKAVECLGKDPNFHRRSRLRSVATLKYLAIGVDHRGIVRHSTSGQAVGQFRIKTQSEHRFFETAGTSVEREASRAFTEKIGKRGDRRHDEWH